MYRLAIVGFGVVGQGLAEILLEAQGPAQEGARVRVFGRRGERFREGRRVRSEGARSREAPRAREGEQDFGVPRRENRLERDRHDREVERGYRRRSDVHGYQDRRAGVFAFQGGVEIGEASRYDEQGSHGSLLPRGRGARPEQEGPVPLRGHGRERHAGAQPRRDLSRRERDPGDPRHRERHDELHSHEHGEG